MAGRFWQSDQEIKIKEAQHFDRCPQVNLAAFRLRDTVNFGPLKTNKLFLAMPYENWKGRAKYLAFTDDESKESASTKKLKIEANLLSEKSQISDFGYRKQ